MKPLPQLSRPRSKSQRLAALACFFYFSCLNNGLTYSITGSEAAPRTLLAPAAEMLVSNFSLRAIRAHLFSRPARAVSFASRRVIEKILVESSYAQTWAQGLSQKLRAGEASASLRPAPPKRPAVQQAPVLARAPGWFVFESLPVSLKFDKKSAWLAKRTMFSKGKGSVFRWGDRHCRDGACVALSDPPDSHFHEKIRLWHSSSLSRGGGGSPALIPCVEIWETPSAKNPGERGSSFNAAVVMPAKAGIQGLMDSRLRGNDGLGWVTI